MGCHNISAVIILIFISLFHAGSCMECKLGHESSFADKLNFVYPTSCPSLIDNSDKQYCCDKNGRVYCCDAAEFLGNGFGVLLPVLIAVAIGFFIVCCLCCLCCPCCLLYKRRHRGTVYGNMLQPGVQTTVLNVQQPVPQQQPTPIYPPQPTSMPIMPAYSQPGAYPVYPPQPAQQPPSYNEALVQQEAYTKQAPYNPNFQ